MTELSLAKSPSTLLLSFFNVLSKRSTALTTVLIVSFAKSISRVILTLTAEFVVALKFNDTPGITSVILFVELVIAKPLTVKEAS